MELTISSSGSPRASYQGLDESTALIWAPALIERHARYSTTDLLQAQRHLNAINDRLALTVVRPDGFRSYHEMLLTFGNLVLTLGRINSDQGYELDFASGDEYLVTIPMRGSGWASTGEMFVEYGQNDIMIVAPSCSVRKHWDGPGDVLSVHVPVTLVNAARDRLGLGTVPVAPIATIDRRQVRSFLRMLDMICRDVADGANASPFLHDPLKSQIEDALLTLLFRQLSPQSMPQVGQRDESRIVPYYVRRAEDFIHANAHRDIGIDDIAVAAGVSLRSIQYGFRKYRDLTPMLCLKRVRYERARAVLLSGNAHKICDVAADIGCPNISQFSRDYRSFFGETPSQTIATPRRMVA